MYACMCGLGYNLLVTFGLILGAVILHERGLQTEASTQVTATHFAAAASSVVLVVVVMQLTVVVVVTNRCLAWQKGLM